MNIYIRLFLGLLLITTQSCEKDWLDEKRNLSTIVPTTLRDMRLLLNNDGAFMYDYRALSELSSDEFYVTNTTYQALTETFERNCYIWNKDIFEGFHTVAEWNNSYQQVFITNVVLEGLGKIKPDASTQAEYDDVKGGALFHRARAFLNLVHTFSAQYDPLTAGTDLGIPLKLTPDVNDVIQRATVQQSYDQIIADLTQAAGLLKSVPAYKTDGSKPAAYGFLAKTYLSMGNYDKALEYAGLYLEQTNTLLDYNTLNAAATYPIPQFNIEVAFGGVISNPAFSLFRYPASIIVADLYNSYHTNDLRKTLFFVRNTDGTYGFRGNYSGGLSIFSGVATDEILLIRAECYARKGSAGAAMDDLNRLLKARFRTGTFAPLTAANGTAALQLVLQERRKELLRRGLRWSDLKRLNKESQFAVTLGRTVNSQLYTLPPNDPRYVFPIPDYIIQVNGIQQNPR